MQKINLIFFIFSLILQSQTFIRSSDEEAFSSVTLSRKGKNTIIDKSNFKNFEFDQNDRILYNNKLLDFSISNDTLFFFDKVKEIESVNLVGKNKIESVVKVKKRRIATCSIFANRGEAVIIKLPSANEKTFVKSITVFPKRQFYFEGKIKISILNIINNLPNDVSPILTFEKDLKEIEDSEWEIVLPKIIKYPKDGLSLAFLYENHKISRSESRFLNTKCTDESRGYTKCCGNDWSVVNFAGLLYKVKVLQ